MASNRKKPSLAEKISSLVTAAPTVFGSDDENDESKAKIVEQYDETESDQDPAESTFRKRNVRLLDQIDNRYKGKKVSRKDVYETAEENASDGSAIDEEESEDSPDADSGDEKSTEDETGSETENDSEIDEDDSEIDEDNPLRRDRAKESKIRTVTSTDLRADVEKGNCVREQLKMWESLLEARIKLQKCLITSNKMPQRDTYKKFTKNERFKKDADDDKNKLRALLDNLLQMQNDLLKNYPETRNIAKRGEKRKAEATTEEDEDEEICSDTEDETKAEDTDSEKSSSEVEASPRKKVKKQSLEEYEKILAENHENYREYRNSVIKKWNDKTRVASGNLNKNSNRAIVEQIEFVLGDKGKLVKRTQLKRSEYAIVGKEEEASLNEDGGRSQDYDSEIYDDDDFYHQLLRELIEYKSSDVTDPIQLSKQWIALQNMRSKMKRKIDTRATKGRRIRYNVHTKLINFMAPVNVNDTWSDLAKNELYNSIFGQIKSRAIDAKPLQDSADK